MSTTKPLTPHSRASGAEHLRQFGELYEQGLTARQIGQQLGISDTQAFRLQRKWRGREAIPEEAQTA